MRVFVRCGRVDPVVRADRGDRMGRAGLVIKVAEAVGREWVVVAEVEAMMVRRGRRHRRCRLLPMLCIRRYKIRTRPPRTFRRKWMRFGRLVRRRRLIWLKHR